MTERINATKYVAATLSNHIRAATFSPQSGDLVPPMIADRAAQAIASRTRDGRIARK
jgi:hypothetical protein